MTPIKTPHISGLAVGIESYRPTLTNSQKREFFNTRHIGKQMKQNDVFGAPGDKRILNFHKRINI